MKKINFVLHPTFDSVKRLFFWIGGFCVLLSVGGLLCIAGSPRGIDLHAMKVFVGIPFGYIFFPVLVISYSYRIKICEDRIIFYMFFLPVKVIPLEKINKVSLEKIASNGQPCAIEISYGNEKYTYPIRLFNQNEIEQFIANLKDVSIMELSHSTSTWTSNSAFDISKKKFYKNFFRYIVVIFLILLFLILFQ